jgi:hypothetical protein
MSEKQTTLEQFKASKDALVADYKAKEKELAAMRKELVSLGVLADETAPATPAKAKRKRAANKSYPELTVDTVAAIINKKGNKGCPAGELAAHFGPSFAKWKKENEKKFKVEKDGTSRMWHLK